MTKYDDGLINHVNNELETARMMIETDSRKVLVLAVVIEDTGDVYVTRSVTAPSNKRTAKNFILGLQLEAKRIQELIDG